MEVKQDRPRSSHTVYNLRSLLVVLLLTSPQLISGVPVYNEDAIHTTENFDPAEADPTGNITCLGGPPNLQLPMLGDFDPNQASMQELCAKPQYNGGAPGQHVGAYCYIEPHEQSTGEVGFDVSPGAQASNVLQNQRVFLTCFYRCFCTHGLADKSVQPKGNYPFFKTWRRPSRQTYELQIDIENDFTTPIEDKMGKRGIERVRSAEPVTWSQIEEPPNAFGERHLPVSLDAGNEIECRGDLPDFNLPAPYSTSDFANLQEMCAVQLSGGSRYANAGGYCHRSDSLVGPKNTVWFDDDMTPRLDWTWAGGNFFASAAIRFYCWQRCACQVDPSRDNDTISLWAFVQGHELTYRPNGAMMVQSSSSNSVQTQETQILPPQNGTGSPSGTCGASATEFCPKAWDEANYGPVPRTPPGVTDLVKPDPPNTNSTVCGNECKKASDCASTDDKYGCSCAIPNSDDARTLGLDPVAPVAMCLALFMSSLQANSMVEKVTSLSGRDNGEYVDSRGLPHTCKCNETFVGDECCGSRDGIIWLS